MAREREREKRKRERGIEYKEFGRKDSNFVFVFLTGENCLHTRICNSQSTNPEIFTAGCSQVDVVSIVVVNTTFSEHCVIFKFRLT
jgi:hypothetical protein